MLHQVSQAAKTRFCMPGHKGGVLGGELFPFDITELEGADNLYLPRGVIRETQELYAEHIGAKSSFLLVNGSSCGVQAAVLSALKPGDKVLVARDVHLSAINAFILGDIQPVFVYPDVPQGGLPGVITPARLKRAIRVHPDAKAVYLTYPNYYGLCADLHGICDAAHAAGMAVICDAAHAAAFDFSELLPMSPSGAGCDIWTVSLHKTLLAFNQCAALCVGAAAELPARTVQARLNMLQTTSPSYLLLASCDGALAFMRGEGKQRLGAAVALVEENIAKIEALGGYLCVTRDVPTAAGAVDRDILRLVIDVTDRGVSGIGAARALAEKGVFVEAADLSHIILICTVADTPEDFRRLRAALDGVKGANYHIKTGAGALLRRAVMETPLSGSMRSAAFAGRKPVLFTESAGHISAVSAGAYPPGVPAILPGQKITPEMVTYLTALKQDGFGLFGCGTHIETVEG